MLLWEEMNVVLQKEIEELKKVLANGGASDYADYRQLVGKIEGIEWSMSHLQHIVKNRIYEDVEE
jgi:hypothetical protein